MEHKLHHDYTDPLQAAITYCSAALIFLQQMPWMSLGAAVLLVARLIQDVPPAIRIMREWRARKKQGTLF